MNTEESRLKLNWLDKVRRIQIRKMDRVWIRNRRTEEDICLEVPAKVSIKGEEEIKKVYSLDFNLIVDRLTRPYSKWWFDLQENRRLVFEIRSFNFRNYKPQLTIWPWILTIRLRKNGHISFGVKANKPKIED